MTTWRRTTFDDFFVKRGFQRRQGGAHRGDPRPSSKKFKPARVDRFVLESFPSQKKMGLRAIDVVWAWRPPRDHSKCREKVIQRQVLHLWREWARCEEEYNPFTYLNPNRDLSGPTFVIDALPTQTVLATTLLEESPLLVVRGNRSTGKTNLMNLVGDLFQRQTDCHYFASSPGRRSIRIPANLLKLWGISQEEAQRIAKLKNNADILRALDAFMTERGKILVIGIDGYSDMAAIKTHPSSALFLSLFRNPYQFRSLRFIFVIPSEETQPTKTSAISLSEDFESALAVTRQIHLQFLSRPEMEVYVARMFELFQMSAPKDFNFLKLWELTHGNLALINALLYRYGMAWMNESVARDGSEFARWLNKQREPAPIIIR